MEKETQRSFQNNAPDVPLKQFLRNSERFADIFNACFFHGEQRVDPKTLTELDTDVSVSILSKEIQGILKRTRDVIKMSSGNANYQILAIENQQSVHYAMPLRCMVYDALTYLKRADEIMADNRKNHKYDNLDEFLSKITREDRLIPCYTIVLYWGEKEWDGPKDLKDMMADGTVETGFSDYKMNLVCVNQLNGFPLRNKDVRDLFQAVGDLYKTGGREVSESLRNVRVEVAYVAACITGTLNQYERILKENSKNREEYFDMCEAVKKAFAETAQEAKNEKEEEMVVHFLGKNNRISDVTEMLGVAEARVREIADKNGIILTE